MSLMQWISFIAVMALILLAPVGYAAKRTPTRGKASWYGLECDGQPMANGQPFNPEALTCASWFYPLGTRLEVRRVEGTGLRSVWVTVTDRGPAKRLVRQGRIIDLSKAAFERLAPLSLGLIEVEVSVVPPRQVTHHRVWDPIWEV